MSLCVFFNEPTNTERLSVMRRETLACRSNTATTGTSGPTMPRTSSNRSPSGSSVPSASAAPWQETNTPSTGSTDLRPAPISARNSWKKPRSTGPPGCACETRNGTGVQGPVRSISAKKPGRSGRVIAAWARPSTTMRLPRMSTSVSKSSLVLTGEKRLHSMANPSTAIRGLSLDNVSSLAVEREESRHQAVKRSGLLEIWRVSRVGHQLCVAARQPGGDGGGEERWKNNVLAARDQQGRHPEILQPVERAGRCATQACAHLLLVERARHLVDAPVKKVQCRRALGRGSADGRMNALGEARGDLGLGVLHPGIVLLAARRIGAATVDRAGGRAQHQRLHLVGMGDGVFEHRPAAHRLTDQAHLAEAEMIDQRAEV